MTYMLYRMPSRLVRLLFRIQTWPYTSLPCYHKKNDVVAFGDNEVENVVVGEVVESDILTLLYFFC